VIRLLYFFCSIVLLFSICGAFERRALAYVDPGSSLLIFQGISSVFMGMVFYFRKRIRSLFVRKKTVVTDGKGDH
jgi:hypothetical protein